MKFNQFADIKSVKPDIDAIITIEKSLTEKLEKAESGEVAIKTIYKEFKNEDSLSTAYWIAEIRHTIDINDKFYSDLSDFYDEKIPVISEYQQNFLHKILASKFRPELVKEFGETMFLQLEIQTKTFKPEIIPYLQKENALVSAYNKIMGQAKGTYRGQDIPITKLSPFMISADRSIRKDATNAYWGFFAAHEQELGKIYGDMVKVRTEIAQKLGYATFTPVAYMRLGRLDYTADDVAEYRDEVYKNIVPLAQKLYAAQRERLGIKDFKFYDYALQFKSGNAKPIGSTDDLVADAKAMYKEMSPVASKYFTFMADHGLMDLVAKDGKIPGGYMQYIPDIKSSFIFSNFNGTSDDVDVLTHEFGHSLQGFLTSDIKIPSYRAPGYEACEIHSMSMEFFAYPWMKLFFKDQEEKYRYSHLVDAIEFIPYGVSVDEFQHFVYAHPEATNDERNAAWRNIERKYLPQRQYGTENAFLEKGGYWMRQLHIFCDPFYYIDYTIAQIGAFEFFCESLSDFKKTFAKYLTYDKLGGTLPFKQLMSKAGIANPMVKGTIASITPILEKYLSKIDDKKCN